MKKLFCLIIVLALAMVAASVFADEDGAALDGKTFEMTYGEMEYTLTFSMGPFSPGESGTVLLEDYHGFEFVMAYRFQYPVGYIDKHKFVFDGKTLEIFPNGGMVFTEKKK